MSFRCLRAANHGLYLGTTLVVLAACGYTLWRGNRPDWQLWAATAAGLATLLWGAYYALLRYQVDATGVSCHSFFMLRECILWEELTDVTLEEEESMGTARCALTLRAADGRSLTLSSDQLALHEVEALAAELREHGYLPSAD